MRLINEINGILSSPCFCARCIAQRGWGWEGMRSLAPPKPQFRHWFPDSLVCSSALRSVRHCTSRGIPHITWWHCGHLCDHKRRPHTWRMRKSMYSSGKFMQYLGSMDFSSEYWIFHGRLESGFMGSYPWWTNSYPPYIGHPSIGKWLRMQMLRSDYTNPCAQIIQIFALAHTNIHACNVSRRPKLTQITLFKWSAIDCRYHWAADALAFDVFSMFDPKKKPIQTKQNA